MLNRSLHNYYKNSENLRIHASELDTNSTSMSETELETEENMSSEETYDEYEDEEITLRKEMSNIEKKLDIIAKRRKERRNERRSKEEKNREKEKTEKNVKRKEIEELREVNNRSRREKLYIDRNWREEEIEINKKDKEWYSRANKEKLPAQIVISQLNIGTSRIEIYKELIDEGSIYDIALMKNGNKKRCFITFDKKKYARNALETIARRSNRCAGTFSGAAVNWAYRDAQGETLFEGSNARLAWKVDSNNRTRHKAIIEGVKKIFEKLNEKVKEIDKKEGELEILKLQKEVEMDREKEETRRRRKRWRKKIRKEKNVEKRNEYMKEYKRMKNREKNLSIKRKVKQKIEAE